MWEPVLTSMCIEYTKAQKCFWVQLFKALACISTASYKVTSGGFNKNRPLGRTRSHSLAEENEISACPSSMKSGIGRKISYHTEAQLVMQQPNIVCSDVMG